MSQAESFPFVGDPTPNTSLLTMSQAESFPFVFPFVGDPTPNASLLTNAESFPFVGDPTPTFPFDYEPGRKLPFCR
jgi:hypothetical protein